MTKINFNTVILSDLDGVILDLNYDIKFWKEWLPAELAIKSGEPIAAMRENLVSLMKEQEAGLNWYDLNFWDELLDVDCLEIIKAQEERCSFLPGALESLKEISSLPNPKYILTNGDPRLFHFKSESAQFLDFFDASLCSMQMGYAKEQKEFWSLASNYLRVDLQNSIFIDDNFKVVTSAVNAGVGQVYWINPGRHKVLQNGVETYPSLLKLITAIL